MREIRVRQGVGWCTWRNGKSRSRVWAGGRNPEAPPFLPWERSWHGDTAVASTGSQSGRFPGDPGFFSSRPNLSPPGTSKANIASKSLQCGDGPGHAEQAHPAVGLLPVPRSLAQCSDCHCLIKWDPILLPTLS